MTLKFKSYSLPPWLLNTAKGTLYNFVTVGAQILILNNGFFYLVPLLIYYKYQVSLKLFDKISIFELLCPRCYVTSAAYFITLKLLGLGS